MSQYAKKLIVTAVKITAKNIDKLAAQDGDGVIEMERDEAVGQWLVTESHGNYLERDSVFKRNYRHIQGDKK